MEPRGTVRANRTATDGVIFGMTGAYDDGWCSPRLSFKVGANRALSLCEMHVWLQDNGERSTSEFEVEVNGRKSFRCEVSHQRKVVIQFACACEPGEVAAVVVTCNNVMSNVGGDLRTLSFTLSALRCH